MKQYKFAIISFIIPFFFLAILFIDSITFQLTDALFLGLFLLSMMPCGIVGLILSINGIILAKKEKHNMKVDTGIALIYFGIILTGGGVLGLALLYIVTN